ncbi:MAG: hypothetical protein OXR82_14050, partial [Gammaproteobacteria bacterium]|nr:hypothetical protein [Gammaproteobacteria bacterium]
MGGSDNGGARALRHASNRRERTARVRAGLGLVRGGNGRSLRALIALPAALLLASCRSPESGSSGSAALGDSPTWEVRFSHVLSTNSEFHLL